MKLKIVDTNIVDASVEISKTTWYAQSEDFPIAAQGDTAGEAADKLRQALCDHLTGPTVEQGSHGEQETDPGQG